MKKETILSVLKEIRDLLKKQVVDINEGEEEKAEVKASILPDFTWKIEMKKEWTVRYLFNECKKLFPIWIYDEEELDKIKSDRSGDYTVYFRDRIEADKELKDMSADDLKEKGIVGITLEERLAMEIDYFKRTGKHLDIDNWTLCSGSRGSDGHVPGVDFIGGEVNVDWCVSSFAGATLRSRSVAV
jgi:hypothetical protein